MTHHRENQVTENTSDNFVMWTTKAITVAALERKQKTLQLKATVNACKQILNLIIKTSYQIVLIR